MGSFKDESGCPGGVWLTRLIGDECRAVPYGGAFTCADFHSVLGAYFDADRRGNPFPYSLSDKSGGFCVPYQSAYEPTDNSADFAAVWAANFFADKIWDSYLFPDTSSFGGRASYF